MGLTERTPTPEQQKAMDLFALGEGLVVEAYAGTGKTTTLAMCAATTPKVGSYLAFNKAIAMDARGAFPMTVSTRTVHSVAMAGVRRQVPHADRILERLRGQRVAPWKAAKHLGLGPLSVAVPSPTGADRRKILQPGWQASHVMRALTRFCQSGDRAPRASHFPYVEGIDRRGPDGELTFSNNDRLAVELMPALSRAWADMYEPEGELRFTHDVYVKQAQLADVPIPGEFILMDEAQDLSGVMIAWLAQQDAPVVWVGDPYQQLYEWRGAVNALASLEPGLPRCALTHSWRFGEQVAQVANMVLARLGARERMHGHPSKHTQVHLTPPPRHPDAVLCRTNAVAVQEVLDAQARGLTPCLVGGADEIVYFAEAAQKLMEGERSWHPELACFENWREVRQYVEEDPGGADLAMLVQLVDRYTPEVVIEALSGLESEASADLVVSTAHKAKGREWRHVRLGPDFEAPAEGGRLTDPELRLLYVAATRATELLDISACEPLRKMMGAE